MRYWAYKLLVKKLQNDSKILNIYRISDNTIRIDFDSSGSYAFDLFKGTVFHPEKEHFAKRYSAPFDTAIVKNFTNSKILHIKLSENDKVLFVKVRVEQGYKCAEYELALELTPKSKNAIILDNEMIVVQALRYETFECGRQVRIGSRLDELPRAPFEFGLQPENIDNIDEYISSLSTESRAKGLENLKNQKVASINRKIANLKKELDSLDSQEHLLEISRLTAKAASCALLDIENIDIYSKKFEFIDNDKTLFIEMPNAKKQSDVSQLLFQKSKKLRRKATGVAQENENLSGKIRFFEKLILIIENAKNPSEIDFYMPKPTKSSKKSTDGDIYEIVVDGQKVIIGKNSKGNEKILKMAKASDYWFHLKDMPSSHVILNSGKNEPSRAILEKTAKICAEFSLSQKGLFEVDFTKRRDVSPRGGGKAEYVNYKTLKVCLE